MSWSTFQTFLENKEHSYQGTKFQQMFGFMTAATNEDACAYTTPKTQSLLSSPTAAESSSCSKFSTATKSQASEGFSSRDAESLKLRPPWRNKGHKKLYRMLYIFLAYTAVILVINCFRAFNGESGGNVKMWSEFFPDDDVPERREREVITTHGPAVLEETTACIPRSIGNFPGDFMTATDTKNGGFVIHILIAIYMFAALAVVCDDYFVPSLEHICEDLGLQADVAGATFMAAGSSAPEFMTSVIGVFIANSDVGVGTIVGSAVFNILFIIGVCGLFAGMVVELTWYPLVRDTLFYLISVLTLFLTIRDKRVQWYEALVMVLLYFVYIFIMYFNRPMERKCRALVVRLKAKLGHQPLVSRPADEGEHAIPEDMKRARAHSRISQSLTLSSSTHEYNRTATSMDQRLAGEQEAPILNTSSKVSSAESSKDGEHITVSEYESVWTIPENFFVRCIWVAMCPLRALFHVTIPDSRRSGIWSRLYMLSFAMSVVWISGLTYIMVWMVTIAGDALNIPDTVMGLTLLAAGTSVPDCLSSVFVARDGYGDMAVSNSLGSNVFDILMCLGLPWLIECAINNGDSVKIDSAGLTYSTLTLLATVVFLLVSMGVNKWKLTKAYGVLCLIAYLIVVTLSCLFELNVFEQINPESCPK